MIHAYRMIALATTGLGLIAATPALAETVYNTSLANVSTTRPGVPTGTVTATTTTDSHGTVTTVTGPGAGANRVGATIVANKWLQQNVGGNASVGITDTYARSGNGSASFQTSDGNSKADLEYYFAAPLALSDFQSAGYDWYHASSSTNSTGQQLSFRLIAGTSLATLTQLVYEPIYNPSAFTTQDAWVQENITAQSIFWSSNPIASAPNRDTFVTLATMMAANPTFNIYGISTGAGSGWNGSFSGAVDNFNLTVGRTTLSANFEVDAAVPEPASWAMMIGGFGLIGVALRRRKAVVRFA